MVTIHPLERCKDCGAVTLQLRHDDADDDFGAGYAVFSRIVVPHKRRECEAFQRLERETWPTLW